MRWLLLFLLLPQGAQHWIDVNSACPVGSQFEIIQRSASPIKFSAQLFCSLGRSRWKVPGTVLYCDLEIDGVFWKSPCIWSPAVLYLNNIEWGEQRTFLSERRYLTVPNWSYLVGLKLYFQSAAFQPDWIVGISNVEEVLITQ